MSGPFDVDVVDRIELPGRVVFEAANKYSPAIYDRVSNHIHITQRRLVKPDASRIIVESVSADDRFFESLSGAFNGI